MHRLVKGQLWVLHIVTRNAMLCVEVEVIGSEVIPILPFLQSGVEAQAWAIAAGVVSNPADWHFSKKTSFQSFEGLNFCNLQDKIMELLQIYIYELKRTLCREGPGLFLILFCNSWLCISNAKTL